MLKILLKTYIATAVEDLVINQNFISAINLIEPINILIFLNKHGDRTHYKKRLKQNFP